MKHLKAYLADIPRYKNAKIRENKRFHFVDYKTYIVIPESPPPKTRKVFMVKGKDVFLAQRKNFFQDLMKELYEAKVIHDWDTKLFSQVYLNLHLSKNARMIFTPQKANRYKSKIGRMKWFPPKKTILKTGVRFEFFSIDFEFDEIHKYNVLVKKDGTIKHKITPESASCPIISELNNN